MTRLEAYELMQNGAAAGIFLSAGAAQEIAVVLYDAMRTAGEMPLSRDPDLARRIDNVSEGAQRDSASLHQRVTRLEGYFRDVDGEFIPHSAHLFADHRVVNAFMKRLDAIEKRLGPPPNMTGAWALMTDVEVTQAIARVETELAEMRKTHEAAPQLQGQINSIRKGLADVNAQWHNLRAKLKVLLSSGS